MESTEERVFVRWNGYGKHFNTWVPVEEVREPVSKRQYKLSAPDVKFNPAKFVEGDKVLDETSECVSTLLINDPFRAEVNSVTNSFFFSTSSSIIVVDNSKACNYQFFLD